MHILAAATTSLQALPPYSMVLPFAILLLCIALMPLFALHFWEHHYPKFAIGLGLIVAIYYGFFQNSWVPLHHAAQEYVSFIALIGSLFVISGGINIRVKGYSTPSLNTLFLLVGAVLTDIIGTTGASMLMIRPWIKMNQYRVTGFHIVFFIFIVSNVGGCLTPIGDPPLFLGFLRGVPFWWIAEHAWQAWMLVLGLLLVIFYVMDTLHFRKIPVAKFEKTDAGNQEPFLRGSLNLLWLGVVIGSVLLPPHIQKTTVLGVFTVPALIMFASAVASYFTTQKSVHQANDFNFEPVKEVGFLFIGIFLTMIPALQILQSGQAINISGPLQYYFVTGILSASLDNAPTYLSFLAAAMGQANLSVESPADVLTFVSSHATHLLAISLAAVFFGAMTYIGNGPNFMVKSISEKSKVQTPSFLAFIFRYSIPILLPILIFVGWVFFY